MSDDLKMQTKVVPLNFGPMRSADGHAILTGPCGDTMEFWVATTHDRVLYATYTTDGCWHSALCGSTAGSMVVGKKIEEVMNLQQEDVLNNVKEQVPDFPDESAHCALLSVNTLKMALNDYVERKRKMAESCRTVDNTENIEEKVPASDGSIKKRILVMSGKGGVGKSTVAVNLAVSMASAGRKVGLLDVDIHGPSVPSLLGLEGEKVKIRDEKIVPVEKDGLKVISIGFLLEAGDNPLIWRGPMKAQIVRQFIEDVDWGELDYLIVDCPPGTGDEPLSVFQVLKKVDGAVIVTTPQELAIIDVRKSVNFCRELKIPVLGVIENMSGFVCPSCGNTSNIFSKGGGERMSQEMGIPFLGAVPLEPGAVTAGDEGKPFVKSISDTPAMKAVMDAFNGILGRMEERMAVKA